MGGHQGVSDLEGDAVSMTRELPLGKPLRRIRNSNPVRKLKPCGSKAQPIYVSYRFYNITIYDFKNKVLIENENLSFLVLSFLRLTCLSTIYYDLRFLCVCSG